MLNVIWLALIAIGILVGGLLGRFGSDETLGQVGVVEAMFDAAKLAVVNIAIPLGAIMMMWLGVMRLAERAGMIQALARVLRPIMTRLFPEVPAEHPAMGAIIMNMAANVLGLGNAATPLGLRAMEQLERLNPHKGVATNSMCTFLAINTSSVTLIPATTIAILSSAGVSNPYQIIGPAILATMCSTIVAIIAVKTFQRLPAFQIRETEVAAGSEENEGSETALRTLSPVQKFLLGGIGLLFVGFFTLEFIPPDTLQSFRERIGIAGLVELVNAKGATLEIQEDEATDPGLWLRGLFAASTVTIPFVFLFFMVYAAMRGVRVYEEFVEGAKEGWNVAVRIMPYLVTMLVALGIFRSSGALQLLQTMLKPLLTPLGFPIEVLPMALMRPLSGSGSQGVLVDIVTTPGVSDTAKFTAATMFGSTETTFYVLAVYFGSVAIRRTRHALAAGLCADLAGIIAAVVICNLIFS